MKIDYKYISILEDILNYGYDYEDPNRKGVIRKELEFVNIKHTVEEGYPIITARKTYFKGAVGELLLFLKGTTDIRDYWKYKIEFWNSDYCRMHSFDEQDLKSLRNKQSQFSEEVFSMGKIYPYQYAKQYHVFDNFKENPLRTDLIVNSWQIDDLKDMCLIPCHYSFQIAGSPKGFSIVYNMRSNDFLLGQPINIQFYYLMGILLEFWSGHKFKGVIGNLSKVHLYNNGLKLADKMIELATDLYTDNVTVEFNLDKSLKQLPFSEFIKYVEPENFKIKNYKFALNESVPMLTYKK